IVDATDNSSSPVIKRQESLANWCIKPITQNKQPEINKKLLNAIIYGNLLFKIVENPYFLDFLNELAPNYNPPSTRILHTEVFNSLFSSYLSKKFKMFKSLADITIVLDGWQDISKNSIYGFMALKEEQEHVLDIVNLSANRHMATFLKEQLEKMRNDFKNEYPNIIPV
ncbi:12894_t:CDS:2, partial [Ambispora leptoticha]